MSNYKSTIEQNNTELQGILDSVNALPEAGGAAKPEQTKTATPSLSQQTISPDSGKVLSGVTVEPITSSLLTSLDADFTAENIAKDVNLFGLVGTHAGGGGTATVTLTGKGVGASTWYYWEWVDENGEIQQSTTTAQFTMLVPGTVHFTSTTSIRPILVSGDATAFHSRVSTRSAYQNGYVIKGDTTIRLDVLEPLG